MTKKRDSEYKTYVNLFAVTFISSVVCVLLLAARQFTLAVLAAVFAIWLTSTRLIPATLVRYTLGLIRESKFSDAERVSRFGVAWSKALHIGAIGRLPRSLSWDVLLKKNLGQALLQQARFQEAIDIYKELLELVERENDVDGMAQISGNLAFCYTATGRIAEAESLLHTAVTLLESAVRNTPAEHSLMARAHRARLLTALFEQGTLLETKRDRVAAEKVRRHAIDVARELFPEPDDLNIMPHLAMLGRLLINMGKYDEAEQLIKTVLSVREKNLPPESILVASARQALGRLYCATDRLPEAEPLLENSLKLTERVGGANHPCLSDYRADLAKLRIKQNNLDDAQSLIVKAITQKEELGGKKHPDLIDYLEDLAQLQKKKGEDAERDRTRARIEEILNELNRK